MSSELVSPDVIDSFISDGWIDAVLFPVKSGKEATVYCCKGNPVRHEGHLALKVYKLAGHRSFSNDAVYHEGRVIPDGRVARAIQKKSTKGRRFKASGWVQHEYAMLATLHRAGADVPRPVAATGTAMLSEFIGLAGEAAPQLHTVRLTPAEAEALLEVALRNIEIMLACHVVHGDLSAYNMLLDGDRLRIIDLPQAVDARTNRNARALLARDVANVCRYFASQGADAEPGTFAEELWELYQRAEL